MPKCRLGYSKAGTLRGKGENRISDSMLLLVAQSNGGCVSTTTLWKWLNSTLQCGVTPRFCLSLSQFVQHFRWWYLFWKRNNRAIICHLDCDDRLRNKNFIGHIKLRKKHLSSALPFGHERTSLSLKVEPLVHCTYHTCCKCQGHFRKRRTSFWSVKTYKCCGACLYSALRYTKPQGELLWPYVWRR